jgi:hypothetical protein
MNINRLLISRILITILGILFLLNGAFEIFKIFSKTIANTFLLDIKIYETGNFIYAIIFLLQGYILVHIGIYYKNFFKEITKTLVGISVFFISLSFLFIAINDNSEDLVNSIQPSIDSLLASSLDEILDQAVENRSGEKINVTMSENSQIERFNNYDLTEKQSHFFMTELGVDDLSDEKSIYLTRLIITLVFDQIEQTPQLSPTVAIPLNEFKSQIENLELDLNLLKSIDQSLMMQVYPLNINAYITLLISENDEIKTFTIDELTNKQSNNIWNQLGLEQNVSNQTKNKLINIFLSIVISEIEKSGQSNLIQSIPLGTIKSLIPENVTKVLSYDLLHKNNTIRAEELNKLRESCEENEIGIDELCDNIKLTKYDYFLTEIENLSQVANVEIPEIYLEEIEKINTIDKLNSKIENVTKHKLLIIFLGILTLIICGLSYFVHLKINNKKVSKIKIVHKINKYNLINFGISYIMLLLGVFVITGKTLFNFINSKVSTEIQEIIEIFPRLPIFIEFTNILFQIIIYSTIYIIILIIIFLILHFKLKKDEIKYT